MLNSKHVHNLKHTFNPVTFLLTIIASDLLQIQLYFNRQLLTGEILIRY